MPILISKVIKDGEEWYFKKFVLTLLFNIPMDLKLRIYIFRKNRVI